MYPVYAWLKDEKSLAIATWGLVIATLLLYLDSRKRAKEQTERWAREDELRALQERPTARVELAVRGAASSEMLFAVFNLGNNSFFTNKLIVTTSNGTPHESDLTPQIVVPGTYVTVHYEPGDVMGMFGEATEFKEAYAVLELRGATGIVTTDPVWFHVSYGRPGHGCAWNIGRLSERQTGVITKLPKRLPDLPPDRSEVELPEVWDEYGNNAAVSCPECKKVFIFSRHLNKASGRNCPHCAGSRAILTLDGVQVERR